MRLLGFLDMTITRWNKGDLMHRMPDCLTYCTADEVAETMTFEKHLSEAAGEALYSKLWSFVNEAAKAGKQTPIGGDGTGGTVETPEQRLDLDCTDKAGHWWKKLDQDEQQAIIKALIEEGENV
jgi:hypothetical protein